MTSEWRLSKASFTKILGSYEVFAQDGEVDVPDSSLNLALCYSLRHDGDVLVQSSKVQEVIYITPLVQQGDRKALQQRCGKVESSLSGTIILPHLNAT